MGPTILFTYLKIISLQCFQFQFSVSAKISSIQTHPVYPWHDYYSTNINRDRVKNYTKGDESMNQFFFLNENLNYHLFGINKRSTNEST